MQNNAANCLLGAALEAQLQDVGLGLAGLPYHSDAAARRAVLTDVLRLLESCVGLLARELAFLEGQDGSDGGGC